MHPPEMRSPPGGGGASESVHVERLNGSNHTPAAGETQEVPRSQLVERLLILYPTAPAGSIPIREKLLVARDVATGRIGDWHAWPPELHAVHQLAAAWAGRAALSPWELEDLEKVTDACRHLLTGTLIIRRLGETHGSV